MNIIPAAKLPGRMFPIVGVRSVPNDQMLWGTELRGAHEVVCRLTPDEAEEAIRQICDERRRINSEQPPRPENGGAG